MYRKNYCLLVMFLLAICSGATAQFKRFDTTMKYTSAGYRVFASNKSTEKNSVTISVIGFTNTAQRDASFEVKGILKGAAVDDFNNDGFPDLVLHIYNGKDAKMGSIIAIASNKNESIRPIYFPDILDDAKLRSGYKGDDKFTLIEGTLMRSFPVFDVTDTSAIKPLGIIRHIQYRVFTAENNLLKFKVLRTYETKL